MLLADETHSHTCGGDGHMQGGDEQGCGYYSWTCLCPPLHLPHSQHATSFNLPPPPPPAHVILLLPITHPNWKSESIVWNVFSHIEVHKSIFFKYKINFKNSLIFNCMLHVYMFILYGYFDYMVNHRGSFSWKPQLMDFPSPWNKEKKYIRVGFKNNKLDIIHNELLRNICEYLCKTHYLLN